MEGRDLASWRLALSSDLNNRTLATIGRLSSRERKHRQILSRLAALLVPSAALALAVGACGSSQPLRKPRPATSSLSGIDTSLAPTAERGQLITNRIPPGQRFRGDGDADNPGDIDGNGDIDPEDSDSDYPVPESYRFPDTDDRATFRYGHSPNVAERAAISGVLKRYYAAATAGEGAVACSLMVPSFARSIPEDYGQGAGPSYLRGGKTCAAVMSMLFGHSHEELAETVYIAEVRVEHATAQAVLTSRKMRASSISLTHSAGSWKVQALLAQPLP
jgi:hypothetical protein